MGDAMELSGTRVTVMGLGRFAGGVGVTRWLCRQGADVLVTDLADADALDDSVTQIHDLVDEGRVRLRLGAHNVSDFTTCGLVIANPAVPRPWENRYLRAAEAAGIPVTTEIRLGIDRLPDRARTIGVTGSAGKSTTAAMIDHALRRLGHASHLAGNVGVSLLEELDSIAPDDWVVLELSSAQLHWIARDAPPAWTPRIALITNISPNHLDWHETLDHYLASKWSIAAPREPGDVLVCPPELDIPPPCDGRRIVRAPADDSAEACPLPGRAFRQDHALALGALGAAIPDAPHDALVRALSDFTGLPHRLQLAATVAGVRVFNDSKCTTPQACALAIGALCEDDPGAAQHLHLIAGGYDKQVDLAPMINAAARCARVYTIGATGPAIASGVRTAGGEAIECQTLERAVDEAARTLGTGPGVLLLSPGCASWDQFTDFRQRGDAFVRLARAHLAGAPSG